MSEQKRLACMYCGHDELFEESYRVVHTSLWRQDADGIWNQDETHRSPEKLRLVKCMQCERLQMPPWVAEFLKATQRPQASQN